MNDCKEVTFTNYIPFQLDEVGFDQRYHLLLVETSNPKKLNSWFNACPILAMHRLARNYNSKTQRAEGPYRYLAMIRRQTVLPPKNGNIRVTLVSLHQALHQGITPSNIVLMMLKQIIQCRVKGQVLCNQNAVSELYITLMHSYKPQKHSLVAIEVLLENQVLRLVSRTLTETTKRGYVLSDGCLKWADGGDGPFFKKGSRNDSKNLTMFLSLQSLQKFNNSKAGIAYRLVSQLQAKYLDCFKIAPHFYTCSPQYYTGRVKNFSEQQALKLLAHHTLNLITSSTNQYVDSLTCYLKQVLMQSTRLQKNNTLVTTSTQPQPGLNIQVVLDQDDPSYLLGTATTIIQHVTVTNFGQGDVDYHFQWQVKADQDVWDNAQFRTTIYQLLIKNDVYNYQLSLPASNEIQFSTRYRYLDFHKDKMGVHVTRLTIDLTGHLHFEQLNLKNTATPKGSTEFERVARAIWQCSTEKPSLLLGGLQIGQQAFAIYRSNLKTIPNLSKIKEALVSARQSNYVKLADLKIAAQLVVPNNKKDNCRRDQLLTDLQKISKGNLTIAEVRQSFSQNWQSNVMKNFAKLYHDRSNQWLYLPVRKFKPYWIGTYGIGLIGLNGNTYYYVGQQQPLDLKMTRAVQLKKIVAVDTNRSVLDNQLAFNVLENLLQVGFIRYQQYTILPFPFKYIREYLDMVNHQNNLNNQHR
ncbi:hypothetical protein [Levilactobacillus acidifarinae]|uniref:Uncharacterized protein n=1 Tax=Levilactobacillus acidifarinae DSM 19394 = JCM 15949 TaxID=1423715 RepID=A0A0R1LFS6_9LACO|nr:hypothetical protein [Levilactobacillus acidifarinae]KRK94557.1 hypothetical protein FD25_GL000527 [Levilactobacillus acidifarinae DSM 19394]GEO68308.1 hypothetical protein LAC03_02180 [Levilactobacillus acidifarinae]